MPIGIVPCTLGMIMYIQHKCDVGQVDKALCMSFLHALLPVHEVHIAEHCAGCILVWPSWEADDAIL